eukprot:TRINITY_DN2046_c0_g1_i3.p1 TRINITY_DN2046_c0_g1~~TRINITY_DN2046_c0_g1_i3.p1  ORF type:complete len:529 (+),score=198.08 TRINITY_DN2046_c0_g1_i3:362-1948(+)
MSHRLHALGPPEAQGLYLLQIQKKRERDSKSAPSGFSSAANVASMQDVATEPKFQHNQITFSLDPSSQAALAEGRKRRSSGQPRKCNNPSCDRIVTKRNFCYKCQKRKERGIALNPKLPSTKQVLLPSQQQQQPQQQLHSSPSPQQPQNQQQQQQQYASVKQERPLQPREEPSVLHHSNGSNESGGMKLSTIINEIFSRTPSPPSSSSNSSSTGSPPSYYPNSNVPTSFPSAPHPLPTPRLLSHFPSQDSLADTSPLASLALASVEQEQEQRKRKHKQQYQHQSTPSTESQHQLPSIRSLMNDDSHPIHLSPASSHSDHRPFDTHNPLNQSSPPRPFQQHSPPSHQLQHQQQQQYHHHHQTPMTDMNFCLGSQQDAGSERKHVPLPSFTFSSLPRPPPSSPTQTQTQIAAGQTSTSTAPSSFQSSGDFFSRTDLERFHSMLANYAGGEERAAALLDQYVRSDLFKSLPRPPNHPAPAPPVSQGLPQLSPLFPPKQQQQQQQQSGSFSPSFYAQSLQNLSVKTPPFSPL